VGVERIVQGGMQAQERREDEGIHRWQMEEKN